MSPKPRLPRECWTLLDANFNRAREALRVCEDLERFGARSKGRTGRLRALRHGVTAVLKKLPQKELLGGRDIAADAGKAPHAHERHRSDLSDVYFANLQRAKESLRVLEEVLKLADPALSAQVKRIRFQVYDYEKSKA
jgi:hypothetical protein